MYYIKVCFIHLYLCSRKINNNDKTQQQNKNFKGFKRTPTHIIHTRNNTEVLANNETVNTDSVNTEPLGKARPTDKIELLT